MVPKPRTVLIALAAAVLAVAPAGSAGRSAPAVPVLTGPASGTTAATSFPAFSWAAADGAIRYEFQLAADPGFNSTQYSFFTKNTRATVDKALTNGTYYWRVRSDDSAGNVSAWSAPWSIVRNWAPTQTLMAPASGLDIVYPSTPLTLRWDATPGAAEYKVYLGTDPTLGSMVSANYPLETQATEFTPPELLAPGTYYWAVTPVDAQGNLGSRSAVRSFNWVWPTTTATRFTDLIAVDEVVDPEFSWDRVPGAARYEVEVNSSAQFAAGSKVCCSDPVIATSLSPAEVLPDNVYYWRVRAVDGAGNKGVWNEGPSFDKRFDKVPPVAFPSVKNVRMRDNTDDPGTDVDGAAAGYQTYTPVVTWDPVPGASSYHVEVAPYRSGICDYGASLIEKWSSHTATNGWTPLANGSGNAPYPSPAALGVSKDIPELVENQPYCVRVRARSGHVGAIAVYGDFTYLDDGTGASFTWRGLPAGGSCSPSCNSGYLGADDYRLPLRGTTVGRMPLLTWNPLAGKASYWVIVAKDSNFVTIVDYALTEVAAYAPRTGTAARTYADETTLYYWVVLPANIEDGGLAASDPLLAAASDFQKQSTPPTLLGPAAGAVLADQPVFRWTAAQHARRYYLQVARDASFGDLVDEEVTSATSYSSNETYPADTVLYWRVRAEDEENRGLTWSETRTFQKTLTTPVLAPGNPTSGDFIPTTQWTPVPGAVSYDFEIQIPDTGWKQDGRGIYASAVTFIKMTGNGVFQWRVRANFPKQTAGITAGPWTPYASFVRTIREPASPAEETGQNRLLLTWNAKTGAKRYRVQVSAREDFAPPLDSFTTDNPNFASTLTHPSYAPGGTFWWRVAALDANDTIGDYTTARQFMLPKLLAPPPTTSPPPPVLPPPPAPTVKYLRVMAKGYPVYRRYRTVTLYVKNAATSKPIYRAAVRLSGAGLAARTKYTGALGVAKFYIRPSRYGLVTLKVSKLGFRTTSLYRTVRAP